jgi:hypothetical protein
LEQAQAVARQDRLLLCALDRREEVEGVGFFEFLAGLFSLSVSP